MKQQSHMPIRDFSRLTGIRKENLRFYDQIGLLSPELRADNGYRYYAWRQIESALLISDLRALGVGIEEIKRYSTQRSPQKMLRLFADQDDRIQAEIERLRVIQELMQIRTNMAIMAMEHHENDLFLEKKEKEPIFLTPPFEAGVSEEEGVLQAYDYAIEQGVNPSYPFGGIVAQKSLKSDAAPPIFQCYFKTRKKHNAYKPAGLYAVAYGRCELGQSGALYSCLLSFLQKKGRRIAGDAYEEYPLDELAVHEGEPYVVRIEIRVD